MGNTGAPISLRDDEVASVLAGSFSPSAHILFVTDCCHSDAACGLSHQSLRGRPIVHMSAVKGSQEPQESGGGGVFTGALVETIEAMMNNSPVVHDFSVVHVFNRCFEKACFKKQDFSFEKTVGFDPDTFRWPLVPPAGWSDTGLS